MLTADSAGARILVIDDDAALLAFTCKYLSRLGYRVVPYRSAEEAWTHFQAVAAHYSLAVIDLSMPGISGGHLAQMMFGLDPEIRLILTSGYPFDPQGSLEAEPDRVAFLHKPFTPAMLAEAVNRLIRTEPKRDAD
jgi:DNA-binding NtrC family response regulator